VIFRGGVDLKYEEIYRLFQVLFPIQAFGCLKWTPCDERSIRLRLSGHNEFMFTAVNDKEWKFETIENYLRGGIIND